MSKQNKKHILIIEDEAMVSEALRIFLEGEYNIEIARDGKSGLKKLQTEMPDLVLLDLLLPIVDGFKILEIAQNDPKTKHIPIIVITNLGQDKDIDKAFALGASSFMIKTERKLSEVSKKIKDALS
ncbi:response regulator [Candidatus Peregrinibacteria bacterium CG11_big_fil_rev_8_21_14_0_20_41_10]|nr:MAG: response regulator [Candidatus Peregrinibacteria bacterium CG11_big_fil_rev_8_21_14_0_20_41_10]PJC37722.1 MAG: response regulator [Candidatus Peregrinibacteria bacterium CG_4_9_14_0_2_um_filter_41_14]